jgi:archaemetzincin
MRVAVLGIGQVTPEILETVAEGLSRIFPNTVCTVLNESLALPADAFDRRRSQYSSTSILFALRSFVAENKGFDRFLGVADVDLYAANLNFVFGESFASGRVAVVSVRRLFPQFYDQDENFAVFSQRVIKEAVHELGHTLGLHHCLESFCVMRFSNSIFEVDKKQSLFCDQCYLNASAAIKDMGHWT